MWTNPGLSRVEKKKKKNGFGGKIGKMLTLNLIWIFSFLSLQSCFTFGVCIRNFIYTHNYQYDIKST